MGRNTLDGTSGRRTVKVRRLVAAATVPLLAAAVATPAVSQAAPERRPDPVESHAPATALAVGEATFWRGPATASAPPAGTAPNSFFEAMLASDVACATKDVGCVDYRVTVAPGATRLRAAVDWGRFTSPFAIQLKDPAGQVFRDLAGGQYSAEVSAPAPAAGVWTIRVMALSSNPSVFRGRAKLEGAAALPPAKVRDQLPNLRLTPPFEFSLAGANGNCQDSERTQYQAVRCLRFSTGPANVGTGPLELRLRPESPTAETGPTVQRIRRTDGSFRERLAGPYEFHAEHNHYHHSGVAGFELLRERPGSRALTPVGRSPKQGYCMVDSVIADWGSFANEPGRNLVAGEYGNACGLAGVGLPSQAATGADIGLSAGWGDVYTYFTEANYVELGAARDGRYVVRGTTDAPTAERPGGTILESDEADNTSYAYIEIAGDCVTVLERGFGFGPRDPRKTVTNDVRAPVVSGQCTAARAASAGATEPSF